MFYPAKVNNRLNRRPFHPERNAGRVMLNPHYPVSLHAPVPSICDSTAFQTMLARKTAARALSDQLAYQERVRWGLYECGLVADPDAWHFEAIVHYDQMLGVDEAYDEAGRKVKVRGTESSARAAIAETLAAAGHYARCADGIEPVIAYAAQGVNPDQYINECVIPLLDLVRPERDWLALGGFCIIGRVPSLKPHFYATLERVVPIVRKHRIPRIHILGVCVGDAMRFAMQLARREGIAISTDSSSIEVNSIMGKEWTGGRWVKRWAKEDKYINYHPAELAHHNIREYTSWLAAQ